MNTPLNIDDIVAIDAINMQPYFEMEAMEFNKTTRKSGLLKEIKQGAQFATISQKQHIVAYFEYLPISSEVGKICSIQVHPDYQNKFFLRRLFRNMYCLIKTINEKKILSATHRKNRKSVKFHTMSGFTITEKDQRRILYEIDTNTLARNLLKFI